MLSSPVLPGSWCLPRLLANSTADQDSRLPPVPSSMDNLYSLLKILPGFIMPLGSAILFISRMNGSESPCSFCRCPVFPMPIPCSPVQVPPRSRA